MQPIKRLANGLAALASSEHYLFSPSDLRVLLADLSDQAFKTLLTRAVSAGMLQRVCRGIYLYPQTSVPQGLVLYHAAARLRAGAFNYLSLESVLSEAGVISQVPLNWITVMSSGRSSIIPCAQWGSIEFVHTARTPDAVAPALQYDVRCHLWRASVVQALQDMRATRRTTLELVDWTAAKEFGV